MRKSLARAMNEKDESLRPNNQGKKAQVTKECVCPFCGTAIPTEDDYDFILKDEIHYCYYCGAALVFKKS